MTKIRSVKYDNYVGIQICIVGRHRWVEYASKGRYNASQVPAEWHGWLHFVTDHTGDQVSQNTLYKTYIYHLKHQKHKPTFFSFLNYTIFIYGRYSCTLVTLKNGLLLQLLMLKPKRYGLDHKENFTGEGEEHIYHSKGHALNPGQRDWTRYQSWQPTKT